MTDTPDSRSLSNLELLVLARVSCSDGANEAELADMLAEVAPPDGLPSARDHAAQALETLQRRGLATRPKPPNKRTPEPRSKITDTGRRALRAAFGPARGSMWRTIRNRIPALGLEVVKPFEQASKQSIGDNDPLAVLRHHFGVAQATTVTTLCDALIARKLGFAGSVTLSQLRAHILVHDLGIQGTASSAKELESLARRAADQICGRAPNDKRSLGQVLGQRWAYRTLGAAAVAPGPLAFASHASHGRPTLHTVPKLPMDQPPEMPSSPPTPDAPQRAASPPATPADLVLTLVREAIPRIGADGRFGDEKVFVSAIWQYLEDEGRLGGWSLDRFKRWLVKANTDQLLDLARADAQGDMDSRLVEDSEIQDQGAAFHFVVDRQAPTSSRGRHAR